MRALGGSLLLRRAPCSAPLLATRRLALPASAPSDGYDTPVAPFTAELEVKKSRFVATVAPCATPEDALAFVARHRDGDARHNCWAYRCGDAFRCADDGEPGGTAGRPILAALEASGLDRAVVLVVRFFGGVKLGAGGLTRAYGGAASACLRGVGRQRVRPQLDGRVQCSFAQRGAVYACLEALSAVRLGEAFGADGATLTVAVRLPAACAPALDAALREATSGRVRFDTNQQTSADDT